MTPLSTAHLVPGRGIEGDRYYLGLGSFPSGDLPAYEVSLIEEDMYRELAREGLLRKWPSHPPLFQGGVRRPSQAFSKG